MLDWFTAAQWGALFGLLTLGAVVIAGYAALREVIVERRAMRDQDAPER